MGTYVATDGAATIIGGPWAWDGVAAWSHPVNTVRLSDALGQGYSWPPQAPRPDPDASAIHVYADSTHGVGVGDDTAFIQGALDRISLALGADTVTIHDGTWMINGVNTAQVVENMRYQGGGLRPRAGTRLVLSPGATLKIIPNGSAGYACVYIGRGQDNVTLTGGGNILGDRATHNYSSQSAPTHEFGYGVAIEGAENVVVDGVNVYGCTGDSVFIGGIGIRQNPTHLEAHRVTVRGCYLDGARRNNISVVDATLVTIEGNIISRAGTNDGVTDGVTPRAGIDIEGAVDGPTIYQIPAQVTVRGNYFVGGAAESVNTYTSQHTVVAGNFADSSMNLGFGAKAVISDNVIVSTVTTTRPGIGMGLFSAEETTYRAEATISGNVISGFAAGITVSRDLVTISGNQISNCPGVGVSAFSAEDVMIVGNHVIDGGTDSTGVNVYASQRVLVSENEIRNMTLGAQVFGSSSEITLQGNRISRANRGCYVAGGSQAEVLGNSFRLAGHSSGESYGVVWDATAEVLCEGNVFHKPVSQAVQAASGGTGGVSRILGNRILGATVAASAISCTGGAHEVVGNEIIYDRASTVLYAIGILSGAGSRVIGNRVSNVGAGAFNKAIDSSAATGTTISDNVLPPSATPIAPNVTDVIGPNTVLGGGVIAKAANYTATVTDRTILGTGGAGGITITLPAAMANLRYEIKKVDAGAGAVTVATTSSQTIDGATTKSLPARYDKVTVVSDGTAWHVT